MNISQLFKHQATFLKQLVKKDNYFKRFILSEINHLDYDKDLETYVLNCKFKELSSGIIKTKKIVVKSDIFDFYQFLDDQELQSVKNVQDVIKISQSQNILERNHHEIICNMQSTQIKRQRSDSIKQLSTTTITDNSLVPNLSNISKSNISHLVSEEKHKSSIYSEHLFDYDKYLSQKSSRRLKIKPFKCSFYDFRHLRKQINEQFRHGYYQKPIKKRKQSNKNYQNIDQNQTYYRTNSSFQLSSLDKSKQKSYLCINKNKKSQKISLISENKQDQSQTHHLKNENILENLQHTAQISSIQSSVTSNDNLPLIQTIKNFIRNKNTLIKEKKKLSQKSMNYHNRSLQIYGRNHKASQRNSLKFKIQTPVLNKPNEQKSIKIEVLQK